MQCFWDVVQRTQTFKTFYHLIILHDVTKLKPYQWECPLCVCVCVCSLYIPSPGTMMSFWSPPRTPIHCSTRTTHTRNLPSMFHYRWKVQTETWNGKFKLKCGKVNHKKLKGKKHQSLNNALSGSLPLEFLVQSN